MYDKMKHQLRKECMNKEEEELHTIPESVHNQTSEEVLSMDRNVSEEVVEGFVALQERREDGSS